MGRRGSVVSIDGGGDGDGNGGDGDDVQSNTGMRDGTNSGASSFRGRAGTNTSIVSMTSEDGSSPDRHTSHGTFQVALVNPNDVNIPADVPRVSEVAVGQGMSPEKLVQLARTTLYCINYEQVTLELLCHDNPSPTIETHKLASPCKSGDIDWFISHSWHDDPQVKCAFSDRIFHSRMPLDPTLVRLRRTCV
jgi:hypothetical protein